MTLAAAIDAIQAALAPVAGLTLIPEDPPENLASFEFPAAVVYPGAGSWAGDSHSSSAGDPIVNALHTIYIDVHVARSDLPADVDASIAFAETVPLALYGAFLSDALDGAIVCVGAPDRRGQAPLRYEFQEMSYGATETLGWRFQLDVTIAHEVT